MLENFTFPEMEEDKFETFKQHGATLFIILCHRFPGHWTKR
jgi:hypothetical protein